ncbi:MAG: ribosomal RNA small subunit methyltransferase A [Anaerolineales bacterium]|nr:ribosomal RNA small subunit methyltransferase A [Anaerolineales bacterium]
MDSSLSESSSGAVPPLDVRRLLRGAGLHPRKSLGQNFLVQEAALARVASAAEISPDDTVLEIGAGVGSLTRHFAAAARRVVAVEIDPALVVILKSVLAPFRNVAIVAGDILAQPLERIVGRVEGGEFKVAANIPYYITSAVIRRLVESPFRPERIVLTVQQEVAERICAAPGKMSLLALSVQYYGKPSIRGRIHADMFYPVPDVDSAILRIDIDGARRRSIEDADRLFRVARAGFSQKRKMLRNTLSAGLGIPLKEIEWGLTEAGVDSKRRAETLAVEEWIRVAGAVSTDRA